MMKMKKRKRRIVIAHNMYDPRVVVETLPLPQPKGPLSCVGGVMGITLNEYCYTRERPQEQHIHT